MKNIKKMVLVSAFAGTCLTPHAQTASPVIPTDPAIETHIREWLQKMTLEQKIGQMCDLILKPVVRKDSALARQCSTRLSVNIK